jgi:flagellar basal body-associated protein FliL
MKTNNVGPCERQFHHPMKSKHLLYVALAVVCGAAQAAVVVVPARAVVVSRPAPVRAAPAPAKPATPQPAKTAPVVEHDANVSNVPAKTVVVPPVRSNTVNNQCDDKRRQAGDCR